MVKTYPVSDFGKEIKKRLIDIDMTQMDLARKMGVSAPYVGEILRGTRTSENAQRKVCEAVGLDYGQLIKQLEEKGDGGKCQKSY